MTTTPGKLIGGFGDMPISAKILTIAGWTIILLGAFYLLVIIGDYPKTRSLSDQALWLIMSAALGPIGCMLSGLVMLVLAQIAGYLAVVARR